MNKKEIPDGTIEIVARHINERNNRPSKIPIITIDGETETPHYFEIIPFDQIDKTKVKFFAIDGSYNSQEFYNGLSLGLYTAGYICYHEGKQIRLNDLTDPVILGKGYYPNNILVTSDEHREAIYDELMALEPVKNILYFFSEDESKVFGFGKDIICSTLSKLLSFCQEVLEWSLVYEISNLPIIQKGDVILRDGTLRSNNIKQEFLVKLGKYVKEKGIYLVAITKNSPIKLELSSTFKKIDSFLQEEYKPKYPFKTQNPRWQKICCWLEVSDDILVLAYPEAGQRKEMQDGKIQSVTKTSMFAKKGLTGGRGFGVFFVARLDYVEKLQNYDWVVADLNIYDVITGIETNDKKRDIETIKHIFYELTRLTQEHYILGYPYPLVEAHNFVTLKQDFKDEIIKRVKFALYKEQRMDNVDIENLFLDIHERF
ncbi:MAG: DNA double-strand break repair nuclease NurA [Thermodesulfovibrionales bacterium]|jgi:hypothetical protein